jgi:hypothetical protein
MTFVEAMPGSGAPRASLLLSPNGKYAIREAPGAAAKAARGIVAISKDGSGPCRQFLFSVAAILLQLITRTFHK